MLGSGRRRVTGNDDPEISLDDSERSSASSDENSDHEDVLESWVDWIRRVTHEAEDLLHKVGGKDWVAEQCRRKWSWAGHVARCTDGKWSTMLLEWCPTGARTAGRPCTRWSDCILEFVSGFFSCTVGCNQWIDLANDRETWQNLQEEFVNYCAGMSLDDVGSGS